MTKAPAIYSIDGIELSHLQVGRVYGLPIEIATFLIVEGWAEPASLSAEPTLPAFDFTRNLGMRPERRRSHSHPALMPLDVAADRRRR